LTYDPYDPYDPAVIADPYAAYRELLAVEGPVYNDRLDLHVLSHYDHVRGAARNHGVFSSAEGITFERVGLPVMITTDPPGHTRLRRLVSRDFTPRAIAARQPLVQQLVDETLDGLDHDRDCDLATDVFTPVPIMVIAHVMGVPAEDRVRFKEWSDAVVDGLNGLATSTRVIEGIRSLNAYFAALIAERRGHPGGDDLISKLLEPVDGEELTADELFWFCLLLLVAGNETTTNLLGNLFTALLNDPEQMALLRAQPELAPLAVEECLRYEPPIQGLYRSTTGECEVGGVEIPKGARVMLLYAAANRDPRHWDEPDRFIVTRNPDDHLAFSSGIHYCLGAHLARLEAATVLRALVDRTSAIEQRGEIVRPANPTIRGVEHLPVELKWT